LKLARCPRLLAPSLVVMAVRLGPFYALPRRSLAEAGRSTDSLHSAF